jgi:diadenosine tetraphosphate (Ap4A) HIT family hydrolase
LSGYVCVVARRHVVEPFELSPDEQASFWFDSMLVAKAVAGVVDPVKMNYEIHGNTLPHLHLHLVPRQVAVEGPVRLAGPDDLPGGFPADRLPSLLRDVFTAAGGTHEDWAEFDRVMAAERRAAVLVEPARITSNG